METAIAAAIVTLIVNSHLVDIDHVNATPIYTVGRIIGAAFGAGIPCKFDVKFINSDKADFSITINDGDCLDIAGGKLTKPVLNAYVVKSYYDTNAVGMIPHYIINPNSDSAPNPRRPTAAGGFLFSLISPRRRGRFANPNFKILKEIYESTPP